MCEHIQSEAAGHYQIIVDKDNKNATLMDNMTFLEERMSKMHEQEIAELQRQFKKRRNYHPDHYLELRAAHDELSEHQALTLASLDLPRQREAQLRERMRSWRPAKVRTTDSKRSLPEQNQRPRTQSAGWTTSAQPATS